MTLKLIDTFSGIGGFSLAAEQIVGGFETVAFVECEPYAQKILKKHWPNVPIYDDIRTYRPEPYSARVVVGGFPCQDISNCGRGEGITETSRSGLFHHLMRVIRLVRPEFVVLENVAAILNNGLDTVLGELYSAGFDAEWATFPATMVGAAHQRDRWWLVAYPTSKGTWENEYRLWRQSQGGCLQADGDSNQQISNPTSNSISVNDRSESKIQAGGNSITRSITSDSQSIRVEGSRKKGEQVQLEMEQTRLSKWRYERNMLSNDWRSYSPKPVLGRGSDGLRNRVDRLRCLGNTVVPACAAIPLQRVKDLAKS